ncbi:ras-like GTP-binding protein RYL2 [Diaphorina citri]|uniref:Ras-like GTP-binding protein RYL2 n=1 Tax=Diaphorina citri TaxID=121845 RepID=A0A1S3DDN2_DIACI|nr:ras-like GTP-binding protein RYL2 [Diaphorina citri]
MRTIEGKVVVLGAQGVGKTSMVVRYIGKMFSHHISPTIGASFFTAKINVGENKVKLQEKNACEFSGLLRKEFD